MGLGVRVAVGEVAYVGVKDAVAVGIGVDRAAWVGKDDGLDISEGVDLGAGAGVAVCVGTAVGCPPSHATDASARAASSTVDAAIRVSRTELVIVTGVTPQCN